MTTPFDLEALYKNYPRKLGKTPGMKRLKRDVKSQKDYESLERAIYHYTESVKGKDLQFVLYFSTFTSQWKDWIEPPTDTQRFSINVKPIEIEFL